MRKLFLMLAVLLLASAAYAADVTISCTADGNEVTVSYTASADVNIPRGFGLDIKLSNDETITSVTPLDPNFWVYPGTYGDTNVPVGDPCDSSDTLPGIDSNGVTIEMGSLHSPTDPCASNPNAPDISNDLFKFTVSGECDVSISGNAARGKVVFYDATNEDDGRVVDYGSGCSVVLGCPTCPGDFDKNGYVYIDDYQDLLQLLIAYAPNGKYIPGPDYGDDPNYNSCADWDGNGYIYVDDYQDLLQALLADPDKFWYCPGFP